MTLLYPRNPFGPGRVALKNGCLHAVALNFCQLHRITLQLHSPIPVQPRWRRHRNCRCRCCFLKICNGFAWKCYFPVYQKFLRSC